MLGLHLTSIQGDSRPLDPHTKAKELEKEERRSSLKFHWSPSPHSLFYQYYVNRIKKFFKKIKKRLLLLQWFQELRSSAEGTGSKVYIICLSI